jgi:hypothetical protein
LASQRFSHNEELMEGVKTWLSSQAADVFDKDIKNLFPDTPSASIPAVKYARCFAYNNILFSNS